MYEGGSKGMRKEGFDATFSSTTARNRPFDHTTVDVICGEKGDIDDDVVIMSTTLGKFLRTANLQGEML
jgi:hypothetical protein